MYITDGDYTTYFLVIEIEMSIERIQSLFAGLEFQEF